MNKNTPSYIFFNLINLRDEQGELSSHLGGFR